MPDSMPPSQADFHAAIERRGQSWYAACLRITRNQASAEDAVQEALLSAWAKRGQFDGQARLDTWIHRIAINAALQLLRKQRPEAWQPLDDDLPSSMASLPEQRADQELAGVLADALEHLTEIERVCFILKHLEQWRLSEIADELGKNTSSIKQALFRALKKLRVGMSDWRSQNESPANR